MRMNWIRPLSVMLAVLCISCLIPACGAPASDAGTTGTVNLTSLPAAEVWIDGKAVGTTPLTVALASGAHDVVFKQAGFQESKETVQVRPGSVGTLDASLVVTDAGDPDAVRQLASAFGITVEPFRAPELSRGAASDQGLALMFPRNDIRKEGLASFRIDVTPAYDGTGFIEFRKGKKVLARSAFEPATLVTTDEIPRVVIDSVKAGDTITWGIFYDDARKPVTAQFEVVNKPAATRKLDEIAADRRLARQPLAVRQQLEAEILQNYRLYSEALVRLLDLRATDTENLVPLTGIVSCLRRLDLEDTGLFTEAANRAVAQMPKGRGRMGSGSDAAGTMPVGPAAGKTPSLPAPERAAATPPASSGTGEAEAPPTTTAERTPPTAPTTGRDPTAPVPVDPAATTEPVDPAAGERPAQPTTPSRNPRDPVATDPQHDPGAVGAPPADPSATPQPATPPQTPPTQPQPTPEAGVVPAPGGTTPPPIQQPPAPKAGDLPVLPPAAAEALKTQLAAATLHAKTVRDAAAKARAEADEAEAAAQAAPEDTQARARAAELKLAAERAMEAAVASQKLVDELQAKSQRGR